MAQVPLEVWVVPLTAKKIAPQNIEEQREEGIQYERFT
jgi:hypothetical protein